jgi:hypothetical protein
MSSVDRLAATIVGMRRELTALATTPALGHSSIEDSGAIGSNDWSGREMATFGGQFDGSFMGASLVGPTPPTPSAPIVTPAIGGLTVRWDGEFTDATFAPMDFSRVEVHVSTVAAFIPDTAATLVATIETPRGALPFIARAPGTYYVAFVARSQSGAAGLKSATVGPRTVGLIDNDALASPVAPLSILFDTANFAIPVTAAASVASQNIVIPAGSTSAVVTLLARVRGVNPWTTGGADGAGADFIAMVAKINGTGSGAALSQRVAGNGQSAVAITPYANVLTGLVPGASINLSIWAQMNFAALPVNAVNMAEMSGTILWLR